MKAAHGLDLTLEKLERTQGFPCSGLTIFTEIRAIILEDAVHKILAPNDEAIDEMYYRLAHCFCQSEIAIVELRIEIREFGFQHLDRCAGNGPATLQGEKRGPQGESAVGFTRFGEAAPFVVGGMIDKS